MEAEPLLVYSVKESHNDPDMLERESTATSNRLKVVGRSLGAVLCVTLVALGVSHIKYSNKHTSLSSSSLNTPAATKVENSEVITGWYFYKSAYIVANGSMSTAYDFLEKHSGGYNCEEVNLGCDGYKLTCNYGIDIDSQLHYVEMPKVFSHAVDGDDLGADGWNAIQQDNLKNIENEFSSRVHNKVEVIVADLPKKIKELQEGGFNGLKRIEKYNEEVGVAHYLINVVGQVWDFVGHLELTNAKEQGFSEWEDEECAIAHTIGANLSRVEEYLIDRNAANFSYWAGQQVAVSDLHSAEIETLVDHLVANTGASVQRVENEYCRVVKISYVNDEEMLNGGNVGSIVELKLVQNYNFQQLMAPDTSHPEGLYIVDYENYVDRVHERYLSRPADGDYHDRWRGWDHFLDQHIGIKFAEDEGCEAKAQVVNQMLLDDKIPVGKRSVETDGDHYYAGYPRMSMTVEYNTDDCHFGDGNTNICACLHSNSDVLFLEKYDYSCLSNDDEF